jgi:hypothetical protein
VNYGSVQAYPCQSIAKVSRHTSRISKQSNPHIYIFIFPHATTEMNPIESS